MNLQPMVQGRGFRNGLQQWGEAELVERGATCPEAEVEEEGVVGCGAAREVTEELVGEMGGRVWDLGEKGEGVVGGEGGGGEEQPQNEGV